MYKLKKFLSLLILAPLFFQAQKQSADIKKHLQQHLDFSGNLQNYVNVNDSGTFLYGYDKKLSLAIYQNEYSLFNNLLNTLPYDTVKKLIEKKGSKHFDKKWSEIKTGNKPNSLKGLRIAIDAGHVAGDWKTALIEQKYLQFLPGTHPEFKDTIQISEGMLTYKTAMLIKAELEKEGAIVFITRNFSNSTSFGISYDKWFTDKRKFTLDSLEKADNINAARKKKLLTLSKREFFWEFFRDYDLVHRCDIINKFKPDLTLIVHYNVDEKNTDWLKPGSKNYTMTFIGGGMNSDAALKSNQQIDFLRLLLSNDWFQSRMLSSLLVKEFENELKIKIAEKNDADYLRDHCTYSDSPGVFCRNLVLCRKIASPLVYGECLYQDNYKECLMLIDKEEDYNGIKANKRVKQVVDCYINAVKKFLEWR